MCEQLRLFKEEEIPAPPKPKGRSGGSGNPVVFRDYESYIAKFADNPKTTDDTFTPRDVFEAVVDYVGTVTDLSDKVILRPFFPGGDYEHSDYPDNGVVIDNPPFSIFTKIVSFYCAHNIPFFLFGPGLTIASCCKYCTAVIVATSITFENGAVVKCNFASNLFGDTLIMTAPTLSKRLDECPSQNLKANLPKFKWPDELLSVSDMQTIANGGGEFSVKRNEAVKVNKLGREKRDLFGDHFLISTEKAQAKEAARLRAQEAARLRAQEAARNKIPVELTPKERRIIDKLNAESVIMNPPFEMYYKNKEL